jgi:hypothetical protein
MLLRNERLRSDQPLKLMAGSILCGDRFNTKPTLARFLFFNDTSSVSTGYGAGKAAILARSTGGASSYGAEIAVIGAANGVTEYLADASISILTTGAATGVADIPATANANITISASSLTGTVDFEATATAAIFVIGAALAKVDIAAVAVGGLLLSSSLTSGATYFAEAGPVSQELTTDAIANAVWAALAAANNNTGSMGEKLNDAGSASNPWTEVIEPPYTASDLLKLLASFAAGDATGLDGNSVFKSLDGTKDRFEGTVTSTTRTITSRDVS